MAMPTTQTPLLASWMTLHQSYGLIEKYLDRQLTAQRHTLATAMPLLVLRNAGGPLQMAQLARRLTQEAQSVTSLVDRLERRGLVRREAHARDRRVINVVLTPEGEQAALALQTALEAALRDSLAPLSESKREALDKQLVALRAHGLEVMGWPPDAFGDASTP